MSETGQRRRAPIIAIDGPAGSGKGTISTRLADRFGYVVIDTGAIYRTVALVALREGIALDDGAALGGRARTVDIRFARRDATTRVFLADEDVSEAIRAPEVSDAASRISALPPVREALLGLQQELGRAGGAVAEGRDIGTVVFPDAELKFFLTATARERARRRTNQLREAGEECCEAEVLEAIRRRDEADSTRAVAPLREAEDAVRIDSTEMTIDEVVDEMAVRIERDIDVFRGGRRGAAANEHAARRERMVSEQIERRGVRDRPVLAAMRKVERHHFVPPSDRAYAYDDQPLPIGHDQTISQPYIVAYMSELLGLRGRERVLEIGTGSGYQTAVLAEIATRVDTIEIVAPLGRQARKVLERLGYPNVRFRIGDGYRGWPSRAPYDAIIVTAAPGHVPGPLLDQLAVGGVLVLPVGTHRQALVRIRRSEDGDRRESLLPVRFVPMTGEARE